MSDVNARDIAGLQIEILHVQRALELLEAPVPAGWAVTAAAAALQTAIVWTDDHERRRVWLQVQWSLSASGRLVGTQEADMQAALTAARAELAQVWQP